MPKLNIRGPDGQDRDVDLDDRDLRIGRADQNDIVLPDSTKSVSRLHAELRFEDGQYVMVDANSQNGIWVDGQRLPRVRLQPGVSVLVGEYRLTLNDAAALPKTTSVISPAVAGAAGTVLSRRPNPPKPMTSAGTTGASSSTRRAVRSTISPKAIIVGGVAIFVALAVSCNRGHGASSCLLSSSRHRRRSFASSGRASATSAADNRRSGPRSFGGGTKACRCSGIRRCHCGIGFGVGSRSGKRRSLGTKVECNGRNSPTRTASGATAL